MTPTDSFISHLLELRNRLLKVVVGFLIVFIALFPFANKIYALLAYPILSKMPAGGQMIATAVTTTMAIAISARLIFHNNPDACVLYRGFSGAAQT